MTSGASAEFRSSGAETRFVPGQPDMWAFVVFEAFLFTAYFGG